MGVITLLIGVFHPMKTHLISPFFWGFFMAPFIAGFVGPTFLELGD